MLIGNLKVRYNLFAQNRTCTQIVFYPHIPCMGMLSVYWMDNDDIYEMFILVERYCLERLDV